MRPYLKSTQHKTELAELLKCEALSSNPSTTKKKKKKRTNLPGAIYVNIYIPIKSTVRHKNTGVQ
jgi:hypothetical protein